MRIVALNDRGVAGETKYPLPEEWDASEVKTYCFVTSPNGRMVSDSIHLRCEKKKSMGVYMMTDNVAGGLCARPPPPAFR